jgi:hypothetical protein
MPHLAALVRHAGAVVDGRLSVAAALAAPAQVRIEVLEDLDADPLDGLGSERRPDGALDVAAIAGQGGLRDLVAGEPVVDRRTQGGLGLGATLGVHVSQQAAEDALGFAPVHRRAGEVQTATGERVEARVDLHSVRVSALLDQPSRPRGWALGRHAPDTTRTHRDSH